VYLKNISDCVRRRDEAIGALLDPTLFWLDNIFNDLVYKWGEVGLNTNKGDCGLNEQTFSIFSGK